MVHFQERRDHFCLLGEASVSLAIHLKQHTTGTWLVIMALSASLEHRLTGSAAIKKLCEHLSGRIVMGMGSRTHG
jgi:hypothetical protein